MKFNGGDILEKLKLTLTGLQLEKSFFGQSKMEYLDLWVTPKGIRPLNKI